MLKERLGYFDGLRGLAALVVVLHHYDLAFNVQNHFESETLKNLLKTDPLSIFTNGNLAVCIFFILSGYVLSYPFFIHHKQEYLMAGATKRYFRLQIPILASILLSFFLLRGGVFYHLQIIPLSGSGWLSLYWNKGSVYPSAFYDSLYTVMFSDKGYYNGPVLWTMKIEFYGSLMVFAFLALFGTNRNRWGIYLLLFLLLKQSYYQGFIIGVFLSDYSHRQVQFKYQEIIAWLLLLSTQLLVRLPENLLVAMEKISYLNMVYALLIVMAIRLSPFLQSGFQKAPLKFLGDISFSIYLLHPILIASVSSFSMVYLLHSGQRYMLAFWITFGLSMALLLPLSYLFYLSVDKTGMRLANQMYVWFFKR